MLYLDIEIYPDFHEITVRAVQPKMEMLRTDIETDLHDRTFPHPAEVRNWANQTGDLNRSIDVVLDGDTITGTAGGPTAHYAAFIEKGWIHSGSGRFIGPFAFMRPAFTYDRGEI